MSHAEDTELHHWRLSNILSFRLFRLSLDFRFHLSLFLLQLKMFLHSQIVMLPEQIISGIVNSGDSSALTSKLCINIL